MTTTNNGTFSGDGRNLSQIDEDLGVDEANLATVAARTPQRSALKLFRALYPTIAKRADCRSIRNLPQAMLDNIYGASFQTILTNRNSSCLI